jgi:hypothetical protein
VSQLVGPSSAGLEARQPERERVDAFLAALPAGARALLIRGEPGIGKTALWRLALERCAEIGVGVLLTRPAEEDMAFGLGGLVDLFEHAASTSARCWPRRTRSLAGAPCSVRCGGLRRSARS